MRSCRRILRASAVCLITLFCLPAMSQEKKPPIIPDPMRVVLVRAATPGCAPNCREWISAEGDITKDTPALFQSILRKIGNKRIPVLIQSRGGDVNAGMAIGRMLREKKLDVGVISTSFLNCKPRESSCIKAPDFKEFIGLPGGARSGLCASSCVFVLAGGVRRFAVHPSFVGVHQVSQQQTRVLRQYRIFYQVINGVRVETRRSLLSEQKISQKKIALVEKNPVYLKIGRYLASMGVGKELVDLSHKAGIDSIHWLSLSEQNITGIVRTIQGVAEIFGDAPVVPRQIAVFSPPGGAETLKTQSVSRKEMGTSKPELGRVSDKALRLEIDFLFDPSKRLVDVEIFPHASGQRIRSEGLSILLDAKGMPPLLAMQPHLAPFFAPMRAAMTKNAFCTLVKGVPITITLNAPKADAVLPETLTKSLSSLPIEMKNAGDVFCTAPLP